MKKSVSLKTGMIASVLAALLVSGCVGRGWYPYSPISEGNACSNATPLGMLEHTDLKSLFEGMALELCVDERDGDRPDPRAGATPSRPATARPLPRSSGETILVTDFVDIQTLVPGKHGLLMGDLMRGALNSRCGCRILQAEFSSFFRLSESGLVVLSRNSSDIKNTAYRQMECVVGTYSFVGRKLVLTARRINTLTGRITKRGPREFVYPCDGAPAPHSGG